MIFAFYDIVERRDSEIGPWGHRRRERKRGKRGDSDEVSGGVSRTIGEGREAENNLGEEERGESAEG